MCYGAVNVYRTFDAKNCHGSGPSAGSEQPPILLCIPAASTHRCTRPMPFVWINAADPAFWSYGDTVPNRQLSATLPRSARRTSFGKKVALPDPAPGHRMRMARRHQGRQSCLELRIPAALPNGGSVLCRRDPVTEIRSMAGRWSSTTDCPPASSGDIGSEDMAVTAQHISATPTMR